jgi:Domain of unknown function (DUF6048)
MKKTLKYIFSLLLVFPLLLNAQEENEKVGDTLNLLKSVTLNFDLGAAAIQIFDKDRMAYALGADFQLGKKKFVGAIIGWQKLEKPSDVFQYKSSGSYIKLDYKFDFLKKKDSDKISIGFVGVRLGYAVFNQEIRDVVLRNNYWGEKTFSLKKETLNALWLELGGGIRAIMFKNFMIGWNLHLHIMAKKPDYQYVPPYLIPGFGDGQKSVVFGFEYTISYRIPFGG